MANMFQSDGPAPINGRKVMLATTAYENPDASYTASIQASREALHKAGIPSAYLLLSGNCHVDDARNSVVKTFLASDCSDLVFLDADVSWDAPDLVRLCRHDADLVGAVYPFRSPDKRGDMPCRSLEGATIGADGLLEMDGLPTGFMRIRRCVFEALLPSAKSYRVQGSPTETMPILFERGEVGSQGRRSGDLFFCWKWRQTGGRIFADPEIRLGHVAKVIIYDSLGAALRRQDGSSLRHVCDKIKAGTDRPEDYHEAFDAVDNKWGAPASVLAAAVALARKGGGHVIEAGSGLSTVLMAAALPAGSYVYALEHDPLHAAKMRELARAAGVKNIGLIEGMHNGWYKLDGCDLPPRFALGLLDGPPRGYGTRMRFFDAFGDRCDMIVADDADGADYAAKMLDWCRETGGAMEYIDGRLAIIRPHPQTAIAA